MWGIFRGNIRREQNTMISCHVTLNELSNSVADEIVCVDEISEDDPRWKLLSTTPIHRSYKFTPKSHSSSWFVRWGFNYSWEHIRNAFFGRDEVTLDWKNVGHVEHFRIPTVHYRFIGASRPYFASLDTLLVTEYIEGTRNLHHFFTEETTNRLAVEETLIQLGELLARVHGQGIIHNNFNLANTLIQYDDATRLYITDWYDMQQNQSGETAPLKKDLVTPIQDLLEIGFTRQEIHSFLNAYTSRMPWAKEHIEDLYIQAEHGLKK